LKKCFLPKQKAESKKAEGLTALEAKNPDTVCCEINLLQ
jgi:hypothetical protein